MNVILYPPETDVVKMREFMRDIRNSALDDAALVARTFEAPEHDYGHGLYIAEAIDKLKGDPSTREGLEQRLEKIETTLDWFDCTWRSLTSCCRRCFTCRHERGY